MQFSKNCFCANFFPKFFIFPSLFHVLVKQISTEGHTRIYKSGLFKPRYSHSQGQLEFIIKLEAENIQVYYSSLVSQTILL